MTSIREIILSRPILTKPPSHLLPGRGPAPTTYTTARGNNGIARAKFKGNSVYLNNCRLTAKGAKFNYGRDLSNPEPKTYANPSVTQLFYTANIYHDLLYTLGFNEAAGNFETNNNGKGGKGSDAVILNSQDASGTKKANFATPVDGRLGRMRMYIWTKSTPNRDGSFDAGAIIYEYTHGPSNRLTGGPANLEHLTVLESRGMDEGWSDFMTLAIMIKATDTRSKKKSDWKLGIQQSCWNSSISVLHESLDQPVDLQECQLPDGGACHWHDVGDCLVWGPLKLDRQTWHHWCPETDTCQWCSDRWEVLAMRIVIDRIALQPCNPNMVQARDAIIDANKALIGGSNAYALWRGFPKRGLGQGAARNSGNSRTESYVVPSGVC